MAEAVAVIGVIGSIITAVEVTKKVYDAASNAKGLPEAFREVGDRLPIVLKTLDSTQKSIENEYVDEDSCKEVRQVVEVCRKRATKLKTLFNQAIPAGSSSSRDLITQRYWKAVKTYGKGNEVEVLMKRMLEDIQILANERGMRMVTEIQHTTIVKTITEVSAIPPSVPEHVFQDTSFTANNSGTGDQTNFHDKVQAKDSAKQFITTGGTTNFVKTIHYHNGSPRTSSGISLGDGDTEGSGQSSDTSPPDILNTELLDETKLSSVSFTDNEGHENYIVFYQLRSGALCQSAWNSSTETWVVSLVNCDITHNMKGTPLSSSIFRHANGPDIRLYYLDRENKIFGQMTNNRTIARDLSHWKATPISGKYTASPASYLLSYGRQCADCYTENHVLFQDTSNKIRFWTNDGRNPNQGDLPTVPVISGRPIRGSALALVPIRKRDEGDKSLRLFYNVVGTRALHHVTYNAGKWSVESLPTQLDLSATIAAFSAGFDNSTKGGGRNDLNIQVLTVQPQGGVRVTAFSDGEWRADKEVAAMTGAMTPLTIAANQAGRVYGTVKTSDGNRVEIVEWAWRGGANYEKIGVVDTTVV